MPYKWISRFPLITYINLCKKYSISILRFYGSFATNSEVCFVQDFLQVKFRTRTVGYHQKILFPSQTDTFWSWKQVEIKNRDVEQQESAKKSW